MNQIASVETILADAVQIASPSDRADYIDRACGNDADLKREVQRLVANHFQAGGFLETPAWVARTNLPEPCALVGSTIGRYKLLEQIGEGGMGVVFMAEQLEPVRRKVALKIVKPGMDSQQVIARFEAERQALALMDHPNIARVLDAGTTGEGDRGQGFGDREEGSGFGVQGSEPGGPSSFIPHPSSFSAGRPYFVMELVRGIPITEYCDHYQVTLRQRLELFVQVCHAVQHAHQKGIIHRDIKPSNVMVTLHDGVPVPKVIDFGVAKAIGHEPTERTLFTNFSQLIGTPLYMSPEQAALSGIDVDTRSDVYSLGVLLYEMLTGRTPFESDRLREAGYDEMRRIIREEEPPRPSVRVTTLKAACTTDCPHCHGQPKELVRSLRGELGWIVMKCLDKDRTRRYESASALAADVERYLHDEPVEACPPSAAYRLGKYALRHKSAISVATVVAVALLAGTGISVWQAIEARAARDLAHQRLVLADERLENEKQARNETEDQRKRTQANYAKAREAVQKMLARVADEQVGAIPAMKEIRRRLLEDAVAFYDELLKLNPDDAQAYFERGNVHCSLAKYRRARADYEEAVRRAPDNDSFHTALGMFLVCCSELGVGDLERGLHHGKLAAELAPGKPQNHDNLYTIYWRLGMFDQAVGALRTAVALDPNSSYLQGRLALRLEDHARAWSLAHAAIAANPDDMAAYYLALDAAFWWPDDAKLIEICTQAIQRRPSHPDTHHFYFRRAEAYMKQGKHDAALADYDKTIEVAPFSPWPHKRRAAIRFGMSRCLDALADIAKAVELNPKDGSNLWWIPPEQVAKCPDEKFRAGMLALADKAIEKSKGAAECYAARAKLCDAFGRYDAARVDFDKALQLDPKEAYFWGLRASLHARHARWNEAVADLSKAVELKPEQANSWYQRALARLGGGRVDEYRKDCAELLRRSGETVKPDDAHWASWACALAPDATADWPKAVALADKAAKSDPKSAMYLNTLGASLYRAGRLQEAIKRLAEADALVQQPSEAIKSSPAYTWFFLAMAHHRLGHGEEAKKWLDKATASTEKTLRDADQGAADLPWNRRLTLKLLREETATLLGSAGKPPAGKEKTEKGK